MLAVDFFHVDRVVTPRRIYVQFAMEVRSRYVHILSLTTNSQFSAYGGLFEAHRGTEKSGSRSDLAVFKGNGQKIERVQVSQEARLS
jgi:hypothetical protein